MAMLEEAYEILKKLRLDNGLYVASPSDFYHYVWIRDSVYMAYPYLNKDNDLYAKTYHRLLDIFREYEWKLDILQTQKPHEIWEYIHARYSLDGKEIANQSWGHAQHDMIGAFLFGVAEGEKHAKKIIRDGKDRLILEKIIGYLHTIEFWQDPDNGMWEEYREIHASSVGAVVAGLNAIKDYIHFEHMSERLVDDMVEKGARVVTHLFPRESESKEADLAQLSLIYPYKLFTGIFAMEFLNHIERLLLRDRGVIRYQGDSYYSTLEREKGRDLPKETYFGTEGEWPLGLPWLALCHHKTGNHKKAKYYLELTEKVMEKDKPGSLPEIYLSGTSIPNPNTPLGWACAMYILAKESIME